MFLTYVALKKVGTVKQNHPKRKKLERGGLAGSRRERERERERVDWTGLDWVGWFTVYEQYCSLPYETKIKTKTKKN